MSQHRVAVVTGIPAPYREPIFQILSRHPGIDLKVFYCAEGHDNVAWSVDGAATQDRGYPCEFLENVTPKRWRRLPMLGYANLQITRKLKQFQPDFVLVYGYNQLTHWLTFRYCRRNGIPFGLRSDSNQRIDSSTSLQSKLRRAKLQRIVRECSAFLTVGSANRDYWLSYGAAEEKIFFARYAIDNAAVAQAAGIRRPRESSQPVRFLYAGRLIPRKGVDLLLTAFNRLCENADARLDIVGDGPIRDDLQAVQTESARRRTTWHGRLSNQEVFETFAEADVFMLPSRYEPWGLVVNEAMAAGLPVIADHRCGAAIDLVEDGKTGRLLQHLSAESLHDAMRQFVDEPISAERMGVAAKEKIAEWSFDRSVDGYVAAIKATVGKTASEKSPSEQEKLLTGSEL